MYLVLKFNSLPEGTSREGQKSDAQGSAFHFRQRSTLPKEHAALQFLLEVKGRDLRPSRRRPSPRPRPAAAAPTPTPTPRLPTPVIGNLSPSTQSGHTNCKYHRWCSSTSMQVPPPTLLLSNYYYSSYSFFCHIRPRLVVLHVLHVLHVHVLKFSPI